MYVATWSIAGLLDTNHYRPRPTQNKDDTKQGLTMFCSYRLP